MSARNRNFGVAMRERDRRIAGLLDDPYDTSAGTAISDTAGNAFWGSLRELKDRAAQAGMGFRADLSGLGRMGGGDPGLYGGLNPLERNSAKNRAIMREGDADVAAAKAERFAQDAMVDARREALIGGVKEAETERAVNEAFADPRASRQQVLERLPPALRPAYEAQWAAQDAAVAKQQLETRKQAEIERHNLASETGQPGATLTDDAIDVAARRYNQTGALPPLGMGDKGNRQRILSRAAEINSGADIASNAADYATNKVSLQKLQVQRDAIGAFEETAKKNMDVFLKTAEKVADTGSPLLNQPVRAVSGKLLGSENQAEYEAARAVLLPEIARIITNPNLTGVLSDSARHEVSSFNPETATLGQTIKVMKLLKQDMGNRTTSLDDAIKTVRGRMGDGGKSGGATSGKVDAASLREKYKY